MYNYSPENAYHTAVPNQLLQNNMGEKKHFCKKDTILHFDSEDCTIGVFLNGSAFLVSINQDGEESLLDHYEKGDTFGCCFHPQTGANLYSIVARNDCDVLFFYNGLPTEPPELSEFFQKAAIRTLQRTYTHIDILSQRSIRGKLIKYLYYQMLLQKKRELALPLSLSELAGFLAVDRSAMMRELKKMNNENIIVSKGQKITIL